MSDSVVLSRGMSRISAMQRLLVFDVVVMSCRLCMTVLHIVSVGTLVSAC